MRAGGTVLVAGLTALLSACGSSSDAPDAATFGGSCMSNGMTFDVNGSFGVLATLNVHINSQGLVDTDATAEMLLKLGVGQNGQNATVTAQLCDLQLPDVPLAGQSKPIHFDVSQALLNSVPPLTASGSLDGTQTCATLKSDRIIVIIGAYLGSRLLAPLPSADSNGNFTACIPTDCAAGPIVSGCACDQEPDGHPGATLAVSNVPAVPLDQVYVDLRTTFTLTGQVWSSDEIRGEVDPTLEQGILGCSKVGGVACSAGEVTLVQNLNPKVTTGADPSTFRAVRIPTSLDCAGLIAEKNQLFPR